MEARQVAKGISPEPLLDTYHAERHPVAASMLNYTVATVALSRSDDRTEALSAIVSELVGISELGLSRPVECRVSTFAKTLETAIRSSAAGCPR